MADMTARVATSLGEMAYTDTGGDGPVLFLVHGLPTSKELWRPVIDRLDPAWRVVAVDLHDYGESARVGRPVRHDERADALDELRAALGIDRLTLVGHDVGASVSMDYLARFPASVQRVALLSAPVWPDFRPPPLVRLARVPGLGELFVSRPFQPLMLWLGLRWGLVHGAGYRRFLRGPLQTAFAGSAGRAALLRDLRWGDPAQVFAGYPATMLEITVPATVVHGRRDRYIPLAHAKRLAEAIPGATLVEIADGGHFLPIDTPVAVAHALRNLLHRSA